MVRAGPFDMDAYEVTEGKLRCPSCALGSASFDPADAARAASNVTRPEAVSFCQSRGGRLPTDDEWLVAATGAAGKRYPWGDTGAVCRRSAFGLVAGPCGAGAKGPDTVGAHPLGDSPLGVHDLAGNVAEWVMADKPTVRGGSYATGLATELRTWAKEELSTPDARDPRVGFRCVYDR
jgi:formylglycine-generating enzyme required for sulfatase activity